MRALAALTVFCFLCVCLGNLQAPSQVVNGIWDAAAISAIDTFRCSTRKPNVVLLGSSVMRSAMWSADYRFDSSTGPFAGYHEAKYFEYLAQRQGLGKLNTFDLGIDGATVADQYLLCDKLLKGKLKPDLIVCGLLPRDFCASWFLSERSTPTFRMLFRSYDFARIGHLFSINSMELLDSWLDMTVPLLRDRSFYRAIVDEKLSSLGGFANCARKEPYLPTTPQSAYRDTQLAPEPVFNRYLKSDEAERRQRYENQKLCLKKLLTLADSRGIKVLLVSMPVVDKGEMRISPAVKSDSRAFLQNLAATRQVQLLNIGVDNKQFDDSCFMDGCHLNEKGGTLFVNKLVDWLEQHRQNQGMLSSL